MLSLRPDLVDVKSAHDDIKDEVLTATAQEGENNLKRFASSIVRAVRGRITRKPRLAVEIIDQEQWLSYPSASD